MSTLLNKSYLVKVSTKGGGGVKNDPNSVYVVCTQSLSIRIYSKRYSASSSNRNFEGCILLF